MQLDTEAATGHAQALNFLLNRRCQLAGGLDAQGAQFAGFVLVVAGKGGQFVVQALDGLVIGIKAFELIH
ncbi:hypothetical protein D3C78_1260220 [compost metagenome]